MKINKRIIKDAPDFCFSCGQALKREEYVLDFGTPGSTFKLCRGCLKNIVSKATRALNIVEES